jgi:predicted MPP superfamily phosphohydrolase
MRAGSIPRLGVDGKLHVHDCEFHEVAYNERMKRKLTRRYFMKLALGGAATFGVSTLGGLGYATLIEAHWLALERVDLPLPGLPARLDGFTIVQLSDIHRGSVMEQEYIAPAVDLALQQTADLIVVTGDYVTESAEYAPSCAEALSPLATSGNVLACLGNHDHWTDPEVIAGLLADTGLTVLRNGAVEVADGLWVAAVDDVWEGHADLDKALDKVPARAATVLLAHEPDYADQVAADGRVGIQLSGHSHGGQVRLPLLEPFALPYLATKYHAGQYRVGDMWLYVNRGVGMIPPPVRFNCRPEVTLVTLRVPGGQHG